MHLREKKKLQTQDCVLSYSYLFMTIHLQLKSMNLITVIEILIKKIKRQEAIEKRFNCKFIRVGPDGHNFIIFKAII